MYLIFSSLFTPYDLILGVDVSVLALTFFKFCFSFSLFLQKKLNVAYSVTIKRNIVGLKHTQQQHSTQEQLPGSVSFLLNDYVS